MRKFMPLKKAVVLITHEASPEDPNGIRKAVRSWHNRLAGGSIPRDVVTKLGRELFLDLEAWEAWLSARNNKDPIPKIGRPRTT